MTTTEQELTRIKRAKSALRDAIISRGGVIQPDSLLDDYAIAVQKLPQDEPIKVKDGNNFNGWALMTTPPNLDLSEIRSAENLFSNCISIRHLSLEIPECINANYIAWGCVNLESLYLVLPKCTNAERLAYGCVALKSIILRMPKCQNANGLLYNCEKLEHLELDIPECTNASNLVDRCESLKSITLTLDECVNTHSLAWGCSNLSDVKISGLKTSLSLQWSPKLSVESVQYIVEHAQEAMDGAVLTLPRALESKLPEETMEAALEKGFEVGFR